MEYWERYKNYIYIGISVVAVIAMIVLLAGYNKEKAEEEEVEYASSSELSLEKKEDVKIATSTETIQDGLANMGLLITQEYYFTQVEKYTKEKKLLNFINSSSEFIYSYDGAVLAGVNFEDIKVEKDEETGTITINVPPAEIQTVTIDKDTFKIYSEQESLWNPLKLEDYNVSLKSFEDAAKKKAIDNGILDRADEQAKALITNFLGNNPYTSKYKVAFE